MTIEEFQPSGFTESRNAQRRVERESENGGSQSEPTILKHDKQQQYHLEGKYVVAFIKLRKLMSKQGGRVSWHHKHSDWKEVWVVCKIQNSLQNFNKKPSLNTIKVSQRQYRSAKHSAINRLFVANIKYCFQMVCMKPDQTVLQHASLHEQKFTHRPVKFYPIFDGQSTFY